MALQNFVLDLMEDLLSDQELGLREEDIRFYDKSTTAENDEALDDHFQWRNARYFNDLSFRKNQSSRIWIVSKWLWNHFRCPEISVYH